MKIAAYLAVVIALMLAACSPSVPTDATPTAQKPSIYPDYDSATIPANIAPLNFDINEPGDEYVTRLRAGNQELVVSGKTARFDIGKWHAILDGNSTVEADVFVRRDGKWLQFSPITFTVAEEIDPYISYRLIEPSYENFEVMRIAQRSLENFDERDVWNNCPFSGDSVGQCVNCHSYQAYNRDGNMQMHLRVNKGGTVIYRDGKGVKVNLKTPSTISAGVYPSWHPTLPIIAYSTNDTHQHIHSADRNKVEVQDAASDLVLYDCDANTLQIIANSPTEWETFPYWNHDGSALYYASATVPAMHPDSLNLWKTEHYKDLKYNIYRRPFDASTRTFGPVDTVYYAAADSSSATFPRESPDGRFLLFTRGEYGQFHIWHHDADLWIKDLQTGELRPAAALNSLDTESYHSFSSSGRWIIFSSRREDGNYTRLYIAHFAPDGTIGKPFLLPQQTPSHNTERLLSYNIPEFMLAPAPTPTDLLPAVSSSPLSPTESK